jgi:hypothetical protein
MKDTEVISRCVPVPPAAVVLSQNALFQQMF